MKKEAAEEKPKVDTSDESAVNAFNDRVRQHGRMIEDFKAAAPVFNQRVDKLDADEQAYTKACTNRRYDDKDLEAIKAGR